MPPLATLPEATMKSFQQSTPVKYGQGGHQVPSNGHFKQSRDCDREQKKTPVQNKRSPGSYYNQTRPRNNNGNSQTHRYSNSANNEAELQKRLKDIPRIVSTLSEDQKRSLLELGRLSEELVNSSEDDQQRLVKILQHQVMEQFSAESKAKQVLPCFNLVCTGTCAYGPKCTFLHDPRAQLPRHVRKQAEFVLQSHLHTYRPNVNRYPHKVVEQDFDDNCSVCTDSDNSTTSHHSKGSASTATKGKSLTFKRDDAFDYPTMGLILGEPNAKLYDPNEDELSGRDREFSMWYHLLAAVNPRNGPLILNDITLSSAGDEHHRLNVFRRLETGCSLS